ncbi:MAG: HNH endonuclease [Ignavibacteriae bacterium]|nr:HNH endonuclease [Ignavibacteriota bacterium]
MKKELRQKIWKKYNCKCAYCGEDLEYNKMQVDHIRPQFNYEYGVKDEIPPYVKDDIRNLNPSCRQCNFYKSTFTIEQFRSNMITIIERIKKPFIVRLGIKYGIVSIKPFDGKFYFEKKK